MKRTPACRQTRGAFMTLTRFCKNNMGNLTYDQRLDGGMGRRKGLKIPRSLWLCRFDPGSGHQKKGLQSFYGPVSPFNFIIHIS